MLNDGLVVTIKYYYHLTAYKDHKNEKVFRPYYLSIAFALALASCGPAKIISTPIENIDKMPLKTAPLKEKDLKEMEPFRLS